MNPIREEVDLGDQKKAFKGKTIKIKKMVKKETGSFTLKDTYIEANDTLNNSKSEGITRYPMADVLESTPNQVLPPDSAIQLIPDNLVQNSPTENYNNLNFSKPSEPRAPREVRASHQTVVSQSLTEYNRVTGQHFKTEEKPHDIDFAQDHPNQNLRSPRSSEIHTHQLQTGPQDLSTYRESVIISNVEEEVIDNVRKSTTDFVDPLDPSKHVTKITISNREPRPVTEFNDKYKRQSRSMFLSGNFNTLSSARFSNVNASPAESQLVANPTNEAQKVAEIPLAQSHYIPSDGHSMSTSMYMGNVVTNRLLGGGGTKKPDSNQTSGKTNMYHSQTFSNVGGSRINTRTEVKQNSRLFTVPPKVQNFLDNSHNEIKYVQKDVLEEKEKMNAELNSIEETILKIIQNKRVHLNKLYDDYIENFKLNVQQLKDKVVLFKDSSEWAKLQASENGDRLVRLTEIIYYSKHSDDGVYGEYKREPHKNICELRNLKQEVSKHNLEFFAGELEKMGTHTPAFANTPSSADYLRDCKERLITSVRSNFEDFGQLAYSGTYVKFSEVLAEPQIFTSLGESRLNCLTNMRDLSSKSIIASRTATLTHTTPITCLLNIDDDSFATGDESGVLHVFNHQLWKETHKFKMNGVSSVTSLGRIRTTYDLVDGGKEMRASQSEIKEKHDKNIFLVSGHAKPDCMITIWDLNKQVFVKQLKGHTDDVTAISSLQDGHTLFTGAKNGFVHVYNITKKHPIKTFNSLVKAAVNCLYTFNDLSKFSVGFANGEIMIMTIIYIIDPVEKLAVCSSCEIMTTLKDKSGVQAINESHIDVGKLITGHEDKTVKIWDFAKGVVLNEILANQTSVLGLLIIENPFAYDLEENYHIISCGEHQEDIYFNLPKQNKNFQLKFQVSFDLSGTRGRNPRLQLYRANGDNSEEGINLATIVNGAESRQLLLINIK